LSSDPFSQASKRRDPVYLKSDSTSHLPEHQRKLHQQYVEQQQQILQSQFLEQQQHIKMQQHLNHPQFVEQQQLLLQQQYMELQQQLLMQLDVHQELHPYQTNHLNQVSKEPLCSDNTFSCVIGRGRIMKRADLIPLQDCTI